MVKRILFVTAVVTIGLAATVASAFEWEYVGIQGVITTCLEADPAHDRIFVGTFEGFHYFDQATEQWTERDDEGWIGRQVLAIQWHPDLDQRVVTGRENAFFKGYLELSDDLGETGDVVHMSQGGTFRDLEYDGQFMYACNISDIAPGELLRSDDGGETWVPLTGHGHDAMASISYGAGGLMVGGDNGVTRSEDSGITWESLDNGLPEGEFVFCVLTDYTGGDVINPHALAGTDGGLYEAYMSGMEDWSWEQVVPGPCTAIARLWVLAPWPLGVVVHYAVVTGAGRVLFTEDGVSWNDVTGDLPDSVVDVAYSPRDRGLYVCTTSSGVFRYREAITSIEESPGVPRTVALRTWPNPFNPRVNIRFELPADGRATLQILDLAGRRVATVEEGWFTAGAHTASWEAAGLASGVYLAEVLGSGGRATSRLVLVR